LPDTNSGQADTFPANTPDGGAAKTFKDRKSGKSKAKSDGYRKPSFFTIKIFSKMKKTQIAAFVFAAFFFATAPAAQAQISLSNDGLSIGILKSRGGDVALQYKLPKALRPQNKRPATSPKPHTTLPADAPIGQRSPVATRVTAQRVGKSKRGG